MAAITSLEIEGNVIVLREAQLGEVRIDTQVIATSLLRPWDREEARLTIASQLPEEVGPLLIVELGPFFRGEFIERPPTLPARAYLNGLTSSGNLGNRANVYASGCNFSGATIGNLTYVDLVDTSCDGAVFTGKLTLVQAHNTSFAGCTLPSEVPPDLYGMVEEAFRQGYQRLPNNIKTRVRNAMLKTLSWVEGIEDGKRYFHSWYDVSKKMITEFGFARFDEMMRRILGPWPNLIEHYDAVLLRLKAEGVI